MANQTLTTGTYSSPTNLDSSDLSGLLNGETITINGGHLLINGDSRWGHNSVVIDSVSISSTLGGSFQIDGSSVWEVPFTSGTGNVPVPDVAGANPITGTGVTGELFRVWPTGSLTPAAPGTSMPSSGWIKLRNKTGNFNGLTITLPGGATILCSSNGKRSWIHVVGEETGQATIPRLGIFITNGDWYELGTTTGIDDETFQFPVADACPAIQIETSPGSGIFEWYLNAGSRWGTATQYVPMDVRGKYFGMNNSTGVISIAKRSTNACGFKPATGCIVRVPNVILSSSNSTNWNTNTINATLATRYDFNTTSAGIVDINYVVCNWYLTISSSFRCSIKNSSILQSVTITNTADTTIMDNCAIGLNTDLDFAPLSITNCFTSITLNKIRAVRYLTVSAGTSVLTVSDAANYTETDCQFEAFGTATTISRGTTGMSSRSLSRLLGTNTITRPISINGTINNITCSNLTITDHQYADQIYGTTPSANGISAVSCGSGCSNVKIIGHSNFAGLVNVHPYASIVSSSTGSQKIDVRNIGTPSNPYDCGTVNACNYIVATSVTFDIAMRRIYSKNNRTSPFSVNNTVQNIVIDNVWGDYTSVTNITGINTLCRGAKWATTNNGQAAVYGTHWLDVFVSNTFGRIVISANEPTNITTDQCQVTGGTPQFTSAGQVSMPSAGDQITWTMPYFAIGHTKLADPLSTRSIFEPVAGNHINFKYEYQLDTGAGFSGEWKRLVCTANRLSGGSAGLYTLTINAKHPLDMPQIGDYAQCSVEGRMLVGTTVTNVVGSVITFSNPFVSSVGGGDVFTFWKELGDEPAIDPTTGFRLKVRATTLTANSTNSITYLRLVTNTNTASGELTYPLPSTQFTVNGFVPGSDIVIYDATVPSVGDGSNVIATGDSVTGVFGFDYDGTLQIKIGVFRSGYVPQVSPTITLTSQPSTYTIQQRIDRNYA